MPPEAISISFCVMIQLVSEGKDGASGGAGGAGGIMGGGLVRGSEKSNSAELLKVSPAAAEPIPTRVEDDEAVVASLKINGDAQPLLGHAQRPSLGHERQGFRPVAHAQLPRRLLRVAVCHDDDGEGVPLCYRGRRRPLRQRSLRGRRLRGEWRLQRQAERVRNRCRLELTPADSEHAINQQRVLASAKGTAKPIALLIKYGEHVRARRRHREGGLHWNEGQLEGAPRLQKRAAT
eukprot:6203829-Pleurochrysis_carterae.AAC.4